MFGRVTSPNVTWPQTGTSFTLSFHCNVKPSSFQHMQASVWWFLGCSWIYEPIPSLLRVKIWVFFQTSAKWWRIQKNFVWTDKLVFCSHCADLPSLYILLDCVWVPWTIPLFWVLVNPMTAGKQIIFKPVCFMYSTSQKFRHILDWYCTHIKV